MGSEMCIRDSRNHRRAGERTWGDGPATDQGRGDVKWADHVIVNRDIDARRGVPAIDRNLRVQTVVVSESYAICICSGGRDTHAGRALALQIELG